MSPWCHLSDAAAILSLTFWVGHTRGSDIRSDSIDSHCILQSSIQVQSFHSWGVRTQICLPCFVKRASTRMPVLVQCVWWLSVPQGGNFLHHGAGPKAPYSCKLEHLASVPLIRRCNNMHALWLSQRLQTYVCWLDQSLQASGSAGAFLCVVILSASFMIGWSGRKAA